MNHNEIRFYRFGQWSSCFLPEWQDEKESEYFARLGYYDFALEELGNSGLETSMEIFGKVSGVNNDYPEYIVSIGIANTFSYIGVPDHLNLLLLCNQFAPLIQTLLLQTVFDAAFQDKNGYFQYERLDKLKSLIDSI